MTDQAQAAEPLAAKRRRLLELLQRTEGAVAAGATAALPEAIPQRPAAEPPVLSYGQKRLWFIEQLQPGSAAYHVPGAVRIRGPLETRVLARCLAEIVSRHEILRTGVAAAGGEPLPVIAPVDAAPELPLITADLRALPASRREAEARRLIGLHIRHPFDLARAPLARTTLLRLDDEESVFLLLMHHLISDVWSIGVFFRNTMAMYDAFTAGLPQPLAPLAIQYADYARWQQRRLEGAGREELLGYWKGQLAGAPQVLELPIDHPRPPLQTFRGGQAYMNLGAELTAALHALATRHEATLYMAVLAAFNTLLYRYTHQSTILVGIPIANRTRVELEGLIGLLLNTLVVRTDLDGEANFSRLLAQTRKISLAAFAHQDLPFEKLVEELKIERVMNRSPLFQVLFTFQNVPPSAMDTRDLVLSRYEVLEGTSREDLELNLRDTGDGLGGWFAYDVGLFDAATPAHMAGHLLTLLRGIVAQPQAPLAQLPLLSAAEAQLLLHEWNDTTIPGKTTAAPRPPGFAELFAAQAASAEEAVAAECEGDALTYGELSARAGWLGREVALAIPLPVPQPPPVIAVLALRGLDLLISLVGLLEAGFTYLPLDPEHPPHRHTQVLGESGAQAVLASDELLPALAEALADLAPERRPRVLPLARLAGGGADGPAAPRGPGLPARMGAGDPAYLIFTSGSTGVPKGVLIEHGGMLNHLHAKVEALSLGPADVVAQTASQCFDISIWQLLAALLVGGRVHIYPDEVAHDPELLLARSDHDGITILETVPSLLSLMLEAVARKGEARPALSALRWLVPTGEALPPELCTQWLAAYPRVPLLNAYGPTECSDDVAHQVVVHAPAVGATRVPIGGAIRNTRLYVLDPWGGLAPIGVAGELCVGGDGVGQGYLGAGGMTAASFVPDPFAGAATVRPAPGARLYRTGDLARRLAEGGLDLLGRIDHQVKVRGFRIELEEIEAVLAQFPAVRQAVVLAREFGASALALVAYLVVDEPARGNAAAVEGELRELLRARLPDDMMPAAFVWLEAMPLTANGKVDRRALPVYVGVALDSRDSYVAPRTPVEESLAAIWAEVLKLPRVGAEDNFFEIGGQSLLATQVMSRIRDAFAVELPVRSLFQHPDLAGLAQAVQAEMLRGRGLTAAPPMMRIARDRELPLSFAQERLWFIDQVHPGLAAYNVFGAVRMRGRLAIDLLERSFSELARRHEVLRTTFAAVDGRPVQQVGPPWKVPIPVVDLRAMPAAARHPWAVRMVNEEAERAFDLARGPLIRGVLLQLEDDYHLLAVTAHHIVYDIWSREILIRELGALYEALWHGRPSPVPELEFQYADFASWQRQWMQGEVLDAQLEYWELQLAGVTSGTELAGDRPRPPMHRFRGARVFSSLPAELSADLGTFSRKQGATLFMALLAGFTALLHRYTGDEDVVVGSPIANRNRAEIENLIGFFVNTQVLRTGLAGAPTFRELLGRVREVALGAYSNQDLAFEQLVRVLKPPRDPARQPLFQVLFNFLTNYKPVIMELPQLTLSPEPNHSGAVQFDLIVSMYEADGRLHITADFSSDLFDRVTVVRLLGHFVNLLASGVGNPGRSVAELALWPPAERQQVLREWNDSSAAGPEGLSPDDRSLDEVFAAQAARTPDAVAAICGTDEITYGELDRHANLLARRLVALGVGPDRIVALLGERGLDFLVAALGVFKAGGAYLPLDARHPAERLRQMLRQSGTGLVLVTGAPEAVEAALAARPGEEAPPLAQTVRSIAELLVPPAAELGEELPARHGSDSPDNLAYVIYTSGSTGVPKGAMLTHRGMWNHLAAKIDLLQLGAGDVLAQTAAQTFDISVWQLLAPLAVGGRVHIFGDEIAHDPPRLFAEVARAGITVFETVPSLLHLMLAEALAGGDAPPLPALRWLLLTGEALPPGLCRRWFDAYPEVPVVNAYGPTECSDDVTHHMLRRAPGGGAVHIPIGRPVRNTQLYVLGADLRSVPVGVPGELYVGGTGVGRGYLRDAGRTAEVFLADPFATAPGGRLYRTMDLVRRLPGGELEFLGRIDHQVKIRGSRIELGEIESTLLRHPQVQEAVVLVKTAEGTGGGEGRREVADKRLVAFLIAAPELGAEPARLRAFLAQTLPESMLPAVFVFLDVLPLTPNGKVDRAALDAMDVARLMPQTPYVLPRTAVERQLADIWSELLGVEKVGAYDNFFDLGGHSLLTTQLVSRLRAAYQMEVPLATFFEDPTVAALAESIELASLMREPQMVVSGVEREEGEL
jgi:amino acid adenylation domain-containing protein